LQQDIVHLSNSPFPKAFDATLRKFAPKKTEKKRKPWHLFVLFLCEFVMSARIVACKHSDLRFVGALLLLWKHPDLQFVVGFLVVVQKLGLAIFGRIGVVVQKLGLAIWSHYCCCCGKIGTCNLVRLLLLWKIWDLQFVAGLLILLCKNSDLQFGDILVGPKTHFQNLKLFFLLPSYKVLEE
jgi:hypothetical protein